MSETTAHQSLADFLHRVAASRLPDLAFVWHTANESAGGAKTDKGVPLDVLKEARMGVVSGVWDWLYIGQNKANVGTLGGGMYGAGTFRGVAIELKSTSAFKKKDQGLTPEQIIWQRRYTENYWYTAVYAENDWPDAARLLIRWVGGDVEDFRF